MDAPAASEADRTAYYRAALSCLRFLEHGTPTGRRFGREADERWTSFGGSLTTSDRIDILLRDADVQWPRAFAPRSVFALQGVADDEPFGPGWSGLPPVRGEELWRGVAARPVPADIPGLLAAVAGAWERTLLPVKLPAINARTRLLTAGPSAIAALLDAFAHDQSLAWSDQVLIVAGAPFARQLANLGAALLNSTRPTSLLAPQEEPPAPFSAEHLVISPDADPAEVEWARTLQRGSA